MRRRLHTQARSSFAHTPPKKPDFRSLGIDVVAGMIVSRSPRGLFRHFSFDVHHHDAVAFWDLASRSYGVRIADHCVQPLFRRARLKRYLRKMRKPYQDPRTPACMHTVCAHACATCLVCRVYRKICLHRRPRQTPCPLHSL